MTFEEQVAEALTLRLASFDNKHDHEVGDSEAGWFGYECICSPREVAVWLAPQVVVAIEAAAINFRGEQEFRAAIAALRDSGMSDKMRVERRARTDSLCPHRGSGASCSGGIMTDAQDRLSAIKNRSLP